MHVDDLGHFAKCEWLEELHALVEELALTIDDVVHDLQHRLAALLDRLNHPISRVELVGNEFLVFPVEFLFVARNFLIRFAQLQARKIRVVEEDMVLPVDLIDDQVGYDVIVAAAAVP